jgi:hypothetical protein
VLAIMAVPVGCLLAWILLIAVLSLPADMFRPSYLALPVAVVGYVGWLAAKRSRWFGVALGLSGLVTLVFFGWLLWQFGQGMETID